jgi:DHA2 family multidrug resistance protein
MEHLLHSMTERWGTALGGPVAGHAAAMSQLWHLAYREASTLAYADAFRAIMVAFVIATLLVPLLRNVTPGKAPPAEAH